MSDRCRDEAGSAVWGSVHGKGYFKGEFGARYCNQWGLYGVRVQQRRDAALFPNYVGQIVIIIIDISAIIVLERKIGSYIAYVYFLYDTYLLQFIFPYKFLFWYNDSGIEMAYARKSFVL